MARTTDPVAARIAEVALFAGLPPKKRDLIVKLGTPMSFRTGDELFSEGREKARFHLILSGEADVEVGGEVIAHIGPGAHVGELSLLDGKPASATVRATTPVDTFSLAHWNAGPLLEDAEALRQMLVNVAGWLREARARAT